MKKGLAAVIGILLLAAVALVLDLVPRGPTTPTSSPGAAAGNQWPIFNRGTSQVNNGSAPIPSVPATTASSPASPTPPPPSQSPPPPSLADRAGAVAPETTAPPVDIPPEIVVQNVRRAILQYGSMFGGNPVGTNPEITSQLSGNNPKGINFIKPDAGMRVNGNGELVDSWGTPLFFHQLSGSQTEVRSAGPDKQMWTADDVVAR